MNIGYCRVSTRDQHLELQQEALRAAGCDRIFADVASGGRDDRPELAKALNFAQRGDLLHVWKLDRLGRSMRHLVNVIHDLTERGIGFKVLTGQGAAIDTTTAPGKLVFGIFAALAEFERALIQERVNAGIASAKARGVKFGRPTRVTPDVLEKAKSLITDKGVRKAAKELGVSKSALYDAL